MVSFIGFATANPANSANPKFVGASKTPSLAGLAALAVATPATSEIAPCRIRFNRFISHRY